MRKTMLISTCLLLTACGSLADLGCSLCGVSDPASPRLQPQGYVIDHSQLDRIEQGQIRQNIHNWSGMPVY